MARVFQHSQVSSISNSIDVNVRQLSTWDVALLRNANELNNVHSIQDQYLDQFVILEREIGVNGMRNFSMFIDQIRSTREGFVQAGGSLDDLSDDMQDYIRNADQASIASQWWEDLGEDLLNASWGAEELAKELPQVWKGLKVIADQTEDLDYGPPPDVPDRFRSVAEKASQAFASGFAQTLHSFDDIFRAISVGIGDAVTAGLQQGLGKAFGGKSGFTGFIDKISNWFSGIFGETIGKALGQAFSNLIPMVGQLFSGLFSKIGSWFINIFSGRSIEEVAAEYAQKAADSYSTLAEKIRMLPPAAKDAEQALDKIADASKKSLDVPKLPATSGLLAWLHDSAQQNVKQVEESAEQIGKINDDMGSDFAQTLDSIADYFSTIFGGAGSVIGNVLSQFAALVRQTGGYGSRNQVPDFPRRGRAILRALGDGMRWRRANSLST